MSKGTSVAKNRSDIGRDTEAQVFARTRSSNATDDIELSGQEELDVVEKSSEADLARELVNPVSNETNMNAARSRASFVPSSCLQYGDHVSLCAHTQRRLNEN